MSSAYPFYTAGSQSIAAARTPLIPFGLVGAFLLALAAPRVCAQGNNYEGPIGVTGIFNGNVTTGCSYDPLTHSAHREVTDIVVPGSIGKYPLRMTRYYNSRQQYYALSAIGLGPGWAQEYSWLLWADGYKVVSPHGNVYDFHCGTPVGVSESWDDGIQGPHPNGGTWRLADGGKVHFNGYHQVDYIEDPYGLTTTIEYQNGQRWRVTEPGGRCLVFTYDGTDPWDNTRLLTKVEAYDYYGGHLIDWVSYTYHRYDPVDPLPQGRQPKMMLRTVTYSDGTSATYDYTYDNVPENGTSHKMYPLLQRCDDVRYNGPMRTIFYDYQGGGPHGAIIDEKYPSVGAVSSIFPGVPTGGTGTVDTFTETRGDGPTRTFNYTHIDHCHGNECGQCDDYWNNDPPQQMLESYTDFQGHLTRLGYDERYGHWYINSVQDANQHTTTYQRGDPPPNGTGEIKKVTYPDGTHIDYVYYGESPNISGHYLYSITEYTAANQRRSGTIHSRDANHRITQTDYQDGNGTLLARETFTYCDQVDSQCSNNPLGQLKTHKLKNGAYVHYRYNSRGLLIDKWEPTWNSSPDDAEPKTHYDYYGPNDPVGGNAWIDRVKTTTGPPPNWAYSSQASETYEYDRALDANGVTDFDAAAKAGRGLVTKITHADGKFQRFAYDGYGNKRWEDNELRNATSYVYDELQSSSERHKTAEWDYDLHLQSDQRNRLTLQAHHQ